MEGPHYYHQNETAKLFMYLGTFFYLCGLPNYWETHVAHNKKFIKIYDKFIIVCNILLVLFGISSVTALFTQTNLTEKQEYDRGLVAYLVPFQSFFNVQLEYYKVEIKQILYHLAVVLREPYNNRELEATAVRKVRVYSTLFFIISLMFVSAGGISAIHKVVTAGEIFCPVIPAWPSLSDTSLLSLMIRIIFYIFWLMYDVRVMAMFTLLLSMLVMIFYQFKNLQCYFYSLDKIFLEENLSQGEKELKYENAFKLGIYMHAETLWVKKQNQHVCEWIFASEVTMSFIGLMVQLITIVSGKSDVSTVGTTFSMIMLTLISLAFFMWNGGDITIEALKVSDAMYFSGWENCSGQSSARVRKLVACAIRQAQEPVVYKTLGVVEFSYDAYVKISKLPYTVVSMFY